MTSLEKVLIFLQMVRSDAARVEALINLKTALMTFRHTTVARVLLIDGALLIMLAFIHLLATP